MTSTCLSRDKIRSRSPDAGIAFHDRHLFHALLMLTWGSMFFEQLYRFDETANRFRLRKLAPRMPGSISEIQVH
jgi:hypothetical protein